MNHTGSDCPYSLKLVACQLLLEITAFLRETYQHMPRSRTSRQSGVGLEASSCWADRQAGGSSSRRWSSVLGSPGNSERSNSRSSQGDSHWQGLLCSTLLMTKVKTDICIAPHSKKLTSEALRCGSHCFHTANTPYVPLPVCFHQRASSVVIAAICLQLTTHLSIPGE